MILAEPLPAAEEALGDAEPRPEDVALADVLADDEADAPPDADAPECPRGMTANATAAAMTTTAPPTRTSVRVPKRRRGDSGLVEYGSGPGVDGVAAPGGGVSPGAGRSWVTCRSAMLWSSTRISWPVSVSKLRMPTSKAGWPAMLARVGGSSPFTGMRAPSTVTGTTRVPRRRADSSASRT